MLRRDDTAAIRTGHITSLAVLQPYRRSGLAQRLTAASIAAMLDSYEVEEVTLRVRAWNQPAINLYQKQFGFQYVKKKTQKNTANTATLF